MDPALEEILALLRCPEKLVRLRQASKSELECLNARIRAGEMKNKGGDTVSEALDEALIRDGDDVAYAIRAGIPILIIEEGLIIEAGLLSN